MYLYYKQRLSRTFFPFFLKPIMKLHDTKWLAETLDLSISTIEKLRSEQSNEIPPSININKTIRYSESYVGWWLQQKLDSTTPSYYHWMKEYYKQQKIILKQPKSTARKDKSNA